MKNSKEEKSYLVRAFTDPIIDTDLVGQRKPTVLEFVTAVRGEAQEKYDGNIDEKCQVVIDNTRYSIAIVLKDSEDGYLFVARKTIKNNAFANDNTRADDLAALEGLDFPIASRGILSDSSFKVNNVLDQTRINSIGLIGVARENPQDLGAKEDAEKVEMLCYEAEIDDESIDKATENNAQLLTVDEIINLDNGQCSSKVLILKKYLADKKRSL